MKPISTILVPTDFTEDAQKAWVYALEIALKTHANLHLIHSVEEPYDFAVRVEEAIESASEQATEKLNKLIASAKADKAYANLSIDYSIERGKPYGVIMAKARELKTDLMIMGTKGEASLKRILYGNVTSNVILDSEIPVLTVPVNSKKPYLDRFLFATDFRSYDLKTLKGTVRLAKAFGAEVHIFHVSNGIDIDTELRFRGFKDFVNEEIDYDKLIFKLQVADRFSQGVSRYITDNPLSLVVITRYKKTFLKTMLWANNTQELTYHTHIPMLVLMPNEA